MTLASSPGSFAFNLLIIILTGAMREERGRGGKRVPEEDSKWKNNLRLICGSEGE